MEKVVILDANVVVVGDNLIYLLLFKGPDVRFHTIIYLIRSFKLELHLGILSGSEPDLLHALLTTSCLYRVVISKAFLTDHLSS